MRFRVYEGFRGYIGLRVKDMTLTIDNRTD